MAEKRKPQTSPSSAFNPKLPNDDFTLPAALYHDAIYYYESARVAETKGQGFTQSCDRFKRSSLLAAFSFFEAQLNQLAFVYTRTHQNVLGQIELDILEERESIMDDSGNIVRKTKFYRTEARFLFLVYFVIGKRF